MLHYLTCENQLDCPICSSVVSLIRYAVIQQVMQIHSDVNHSYFCVNQQDFQTYFCVTQRECQIYFCENQLEFQTYFYVIQLECLNDFYEIQQESQTYSCVI